ncbi:MAG: translation elongation factor 4 [Patescibacteria group bacterium]
MPSQEYIRNFCIIAHIDHGKSTLADRLLELTGTVEKRKMQEQILDTMELEREKGITIKLAPARMFYKKSSKASALSDSFALNLIDTPGHVDFTYEVSRSLASVEGAVLLVDATQGVQAQTIGNLYLALEQNLTIIPVLNKIDLPAADVPRFREELVKLIGCKPEEILLVSGKTGEGVPALLDAIVERVPPPSGNDMATSPARAVVFDAKYDEYKGVVAYVRVIDGTFKKGDRMKMLQTFTDSEIIELGALTPGYYPLRELETGQIGYIVTGFKEISACRVGDTIGHAGEETLPLPGYREVKPMVYAGIFCKEGSAYSQLREAMEKLKLNDAALVFEAEHSPALGYGFRVGLLGMLHLEIVTERLKREFNLDLMITTPSVVYRVTSRGSHVFLIKSPLELPDPSHIELVEEPWVNVDIITPKEFIGAIMKLSQERKGIYQTTSYLSDDRVILKYELPLASVIVDFYDALKTVSSGYGSMNYEVIGYRPADVVRLNILVAEEQVEAFATLVYRDEAERVGRRVVEKLKTAIPKQMFEIKLQAAIGGKIVAAERISALRKDVTAKLYGGDVTRKRKLLEKQKKGKKKMMALGAGSVEIPTEAYLTVLKR